MAAWHRALIRPQYTRAMKPWAITQEEIDSIPLHNITCKLLQFIRQQVEQHAWLNTCGQPAKTNLPKTEIQSCLFNSVTHAPQISATLERDRIKFPNQTSLEIFVHAGFNQVREGTTLNRTELQRHDCNEQHSSCVMCQVWYTTVEYTIVALQAIHAMQIHWQPWWTFADILQWCCSSCIQRKHATQLLPFVSSYISFALYHHIPHGTQIRTCLVAFWWTYRARRTTDVLVSLLWAALRCLIWPSPCMPRRSITNCLSIMSLPSSRRRLTLALCFSCSGRVIKRTSAATWAFETDVWLILISSKAMPGNQGFATTRLDKVLTGADAGRLVCAWPDSWPAPCLAARAAMVACSWGSCCAASWTSLSRSNRRSSLHSSSWTCKTRLLDSSILESYRLACKETAQIHAHSWRPCQRGNMYQKFWARQHKVLEYTDQWSGNMYCNRHHPKGWWYRSHWPMHKTNTLSLMYSASNLHHYHSYYKMRLCKAVLV